jgi:threonine dehydrogenase-like Zn-dependent dehydrogenase
VKLAPHLRRTGVLLEPASILAKAWEHIDYIGRRARWSPKRALVTGAGPVGLLAGLMAKQRGLDLTMFDRVESGPKPELVRSLGGTYVTGDVRRASAEADIVVECTGYGPLVFECMQHTPPGAVVCLTGISTAGRKLEIDPGLLNRNVVLENDVIFGSVNANRRHYEAAARSLADADADWLSRIISRRLPLSEWRAALKPAVDAVKTVIDFTLNS